MCLRTKKKLFLRNFFGSRNLTGKDLGFLVMLLGLSG